MHAAAVSIPIRGGGAASESDDEPRPRTFEEKAYVATRLTLNHLALGIVGSLLIYRGVELALELVLPSWRAVQAVILLILGFSLFALVVVVQACAPSDRTVFGMLADIAEDDTRYAAGAPRRASRRTGDDPTQLFRRKTKRKPKTYHVSPAVI